MMLLVRSDEEWEALGDAGRDYAAIEAWWAEHARAGRVVGGGELQSARTATTVRWSGGRPVVLDGPFVEAKESVAGFGVFELPDLDAAIAIAKTWPGKGHAVEIRPMVER